MSLHELTACIYYKLAIDRGLRGCVPDEEHLCIREYLFASQHARNSQSIDVDEHISSESEFKSNFKPCLLLNEDECAQDSSRKNIRKCEENDLDEVLRSEQLKKY